MIFLGIDCGATTSKTGGIHADGNVISRDLRQSKTRGEDGAEGMIAGWMEGAEGFLGEQGFTWKDVAGVGLAIPGPYLSYGVLGRQPNLPKTLEGWHFLDDLSAAVERAAGRGIAVHTANDGQLAGLGEAQAIQAKAPGAVLMLAPGSGLGCAYVRADGKLLEGDRSAAAILCHMPAPYERLGLPAFACGCGRDWGCFEAYTSISGLPQLIQHLLPDFPGHAFAKLEAIGKPEALALRGMAMDGDALALAAFDLQARALGLTVATGAMAYDPSHVVIGGGLIDPEATTPQFRKRYLDRIRQAAAEYSWSPIEQLQFHEATLGELSQAIGAALMARERTDG